MKMCMWSFDGDKINFYRMMAFSTQSFWAAYTLQGMEFV